MLYGLVHCIVYFHRVYEGLVDFVTFITLLDLSFILILPHQQHADKMVQMDSILYDLHAMYLLDNVC